MATQLKKLELYNFMNLMQKQLFPLLMFIFCFSFIQHFLISNHEIRRKHWA